MKRSLKVLLALILALFTLPISTVFAAESYADGEYTIEIKALEANGDSESVAGGFLDNEATIAIDGDKATITIGVSKSGEGDGDFGGFDFSIEWVKIEGSEAIAEEEGSEYIYYTFPLNEIKEILNAGMEYVVPGFPGLEDGHEVDFRIQLIGLDNLPEAAEDEDNEGTTEETEENDEITDPETEEGTNETETDESERDDGTAQGDDQEENPQTGEKSNIALYVTLLIAAMIIGSIVFVQRKSVQ